MKRNMYILILLILAVNLSAQEVGVSAAKLWSDNYEIQNPTGFSLYLYQQIWKIGIKTEFTLASNERHYYGLLSPGFPNEYFPESVISHSNYRSIEFALIVPKLINYKSFNFNIGTGIAIGKFSGERQGVNSERKVKLYSENKFGLFYVLSISKERILKSPIKIELLYKHKNLIGTVYVADAPAGFEQQFQGDINMRGLQINISYQLK